MKRSGSSFSTVPLSRRQMLRVLGGVALSASGLVLVSACQPAAGGIAAEVTMEAARYVPESIEVPVGGTVVWRNTDVLVHTVTAVRDLAQRPENVQLPPGAEEFNSGDIEPGGEFRHTFTVPGEYTYFCIPHELQGMVGHVTVT